MKRGTLDLETAHSDFERAIESAWFRHFITILIIINAIILGVLTYRATLDDGLVRGLEIVDRVITLIFVVEITLKLVLYRLEFFRSGWNWFDFLVVGVSLAPAAQGFGVLRALRVLRVLRLLHVVPMLRRITEALLKALPGMGAILAVLALITYVGAVMATDLFGDSENEDVLLLFGDLPKSAYSLFQVMTMDGWRFEVAQKVIDDGNPYAWIFFLIFIFIASFAVLNFFIALIVEALQQEQAAVQAEIRDEFEEIEEDMETAHTERTEVIKMLTALREEIADLKSQLANQSPEK